MVPIRVRVLLGCLGFALLSACGGGPTFIAKNQPQLADEEQACLASGTVRATGVDPHAGGARRPERVRRRAALRDGSGRPRARRPEARRAPALPHDPAGRPLGGQRHRAGRAPHLRRVSGRDHGARVLLLPSDQHVSGGYLSEHGRANALDVSAFTLADGTRIRVKSGWRGDARQRAFLHAVHDGACAQFSTVLGPDYNALHRDHFHVDLAYRGADGLRTVCK